MVPENDDDVPPIAREFDDDDAADPVARIAWGEPGATIGNPPPAPLREALTAAATAGLSRAAPHSMQKRVDSLGKGSPHSVQNFGITTSPATDGTGTTKGTVLSPAQVLPVSL